jgi:putative GTP pyrophosphokinase
MILKLKRFSGMQLARMQDIGRLRAVVNTVSQAGKLETAYRTASFQHELLTVKPKFFAPFYASTDPAIR